MVLSCWAAVLSFLFLCFSVFFFFWFFLRSCSLSFLFPCFSSLFFLLTSHVFSSFLPVFLSLPSSISFFSSQNVPPSPSISIFQLLKTEVCPPKILPSLFSNVHPSFSFFFALSLPPVFLSSRRKGSPCPVSSWCRARWRGAALHSCPYCRAWLSSSFSVVVGHASMGSINEGTSWGVRERERVGNEDSKISFFPASRHTGEEGEQCRFERHCFVFLKKKKRK